MSTARTRYLGSELRRLREGTGMSGDRAAQLLKWSPSKVSRYERARTGLRPREVERMLALYKTPDGQRRELLALATELAGARHSLEDFRDPQADEYDEAREVLDWAVLTFPRVLQTADYALATWSVTREVLLTLKSEVASTVQATLGWQARLTRKRKPPLLLQAVFDESCLDRQVGTPALMRAQLEHVLELSELPGASVRMLPYTEGPAAVMVAPFTYVKHQEVAGWEMPDAVMTAGLTEVRLVETERDVYQYARAFASLQRDALSEDDTREAVRRARKEAWAE